MVPDFITCSIEFLGGSQTFLGVLIALLVVMPIKRKGNPFYDVLNQIKDDVKNEIPQGFTVETMLELENYEPYRKIMSAANGNDEKAVSCRNFITTARFKVTRESLSFHNEEYVKKLDQVFDLREVYMAPLYMFLYCLVLFVLDEVIRAQFQVNYSVGFLAWSVMFTIAFWGLIWIMYAWDSFWIISGRTYRRHFDGSRSLDKETVFVAMYLIVTFMIYRLAVESLGLAFFISALALVLMKGALSYRYFYDHNRIGYRFVIKHFGCIMLVALLCAWLYIIIPGGLSEYPCRMVDMTAKEPDFIVIKLWIFVTVLCFGLIFPFAMPVGSMIYIRRNASSRAGDIRARAQRVISDLQSQAASFARTHGL